MPRTRCNGTCVNAQFEDRVNEQDQLRLGTWRWSSPYPTCDTMVVERAESLAVGTSACIDGTNTMPVF